jgi:hypothetical protein
MAAVLAPMGPALARLSSPEALRRQVGAADPFASLPAPAGFDGRWDLPGAPGTLIALPVAADADVAPGSLTGPAARRAATQTPPTGAPGSVARSSTSPGSAGLRTAAPSRRNLPLASMVRAGLRAADHPVSRTGFGVRPAASPRRAPDSASPFPRVAGIGRPAPLDATAAASPGRFGSAALASAGHPRSALGSGESGYQPFDLVGLRSPLVTGTDRAFPAPAARAAEALAPLRGTLVRSLAALPPPGPGIEGRAPSADAPRLAAAAGTSDLVEWIRLLGGGHPAATSQDAPVTARAAEGIEAGALVAPGAGPSGDSSFGLRLPGAGPAIDRVRPEGIRGAPLPGLPSTPAPAPRFDVSRSDRSLVSPGGAGGFPGTSFASLLGSAPPSLSGPTYHGTHPLVSTAIGSVAATARLAATIDTPAAAPPPGTAAAEPGAPGARAVDLDGLAAEMSERILRRLKRDKERRGFYG